MVTGSTGEVIVSPDVLNWPRGAAWQSITVWSPGGNCCRSPGHELCCVASTPGSLSRHRPLGSVLL